MTAAAAGRALWLVRHARVSAIRGMLRNYGGATARGEGDGLGGRHDLMAAGLRLCGARAVIPDTIWTRQVDHIGVCPGQRLASQSGCSAKICSIKWL